MGLSQIARLKLFLIFSYSCVDIYHGFLYHKYMSFGTQMKKHRKCP